MEAFSDGVLAIAITIVVLELHDPQGSGWHDLQQALPTLLVYLLSFVYVGIYWNNHHHLVAATGGVDGLVLWANLHLLFWLSLVPWTTSWVGSSDFASVPVVVYGVVLLGAAAAFLGLQVAIVRFEGDESRIKSAVGSNLKGLISPVCYVLGIGGALLHWPFVALAFYVAVTLLWLVPDRRIERGFAAVD